MEQLPAMHQGRSSTAPQAGPRPPLCPLQHLQAAPQTGPGEKWNKLEVPAWEWGQTGITPTTEVLFGGAFLDAIPTGRGTI